MKKKATIFQKYIYLRIYNLTSLVTYVQILIFKTHLLPVAILLNSHTYIYPNEMHTDAPLQL